MDLIDDRGRLFGFVNAIDALAVIAVAIIIVAGIAVVIQPEPKPSVPTETATTHAVLDLGMQSPYVVEKITPGDTISPGSSGELNVTDVYVTPGKEGIRTFVSVELTDVIKGGTIVYNGEPLRIGRQLKISTDVYQVTGTIRSVGRSLKPATSTVLLETTADASTAARIDPGDTYSLAGHDVVAVESVESYATRASDKRHVFIGVSLNTVDLGHGPEFGGTIIRPGNKIPLQTKEYNVTGEVRRVGIAELQGASTNRTVTLELTDVSPYVANSLEPGMTQTTDDNKVARVIDVQTEPAIVLLIGQDGDDYLKEHPVLKDVTLTVELRVRETTDGPTFAGQPLQLGTTVVLDLGTTTVTATVVSI